MGNGNTEVIKLIRKSDKTIGKKLESGGKFWDFIFELVKE